MKYEKINGEWHKNQCESCKKWLKGTYVKKCHACYWKNARNPVVISGKEIPHYHTAHWWIKSKYGTPNKCDNCGFINENTRRFNWANISGEYLKIRDDWKRLCISCHIKFDKRGGYV